MTTEQYVSQDAFIDLLVLASSGGIPRNVGITNFVRLMEHLGFEQKEPSINRSFDIERDQDSPLKVAEPSLKQELSSKKPSLKAPSVPSSVKDKRSGSLNRSFDIERESEPKDMVSELDQDRESD